MIVVGNGGLNDGRRQKYWYFCNADGICHFHFGSAVNDSVVCGTDG